MQMRPHDRSGSLLNILIWTSVLRCNKNHTETQTATRRRVKNESIAHCTYCNTPLCMFDWLLEYLNDLIVPPYLIDRSVPHHDRQHENYSFRHENLVFCYIIWWFRSSDLSIYFISSHVTATDFSTPNVRGRTQLDTISSAHIF